MKPTKRLLDYMPKKEPKTRLIQSRVPEELYQSVKRILAEQHFSWADLLTASLTQFVDECKEGIEVKRRTFPGKWKD